MAAKIFYRERQKIGKKKKKPRFKLVAIAGIDMKIYANHLRKKDLEDIAKAVGAELILLKGGEKGSNEREVEVED
jgi:hypothetical protein